MLDRFKLTALRLLPKNAVSRAFGAVSDIPLPPGVRGVVNNGFATFAGADITESQSDPGEYGTLNAFFTRKLKDGLRPIATDDPRAMVSPVDGRLDQFGPIRDSTLVQAKGRTYTLTDLLDSGRDAAKFVGGHFATIYLSPRDYHRVHSPASGEVTHLGYVPGYLWPVNPLAVGNIDELFAVNERLTTYMANAALGDVGVVMVGATCVGRMTVAFHDVTTNGAFRRRQDIAVRDVALTHGAELGMFNLGSTVILLIATPDFEFDPELTTGTAVQVGQFLGATAGFVS